MNWFKMHHGTPFDPTWAVVAKRAGVPRHAVVAVWCALLDHASQNDPRGSIARLDTELVAVSLDMDPEQVDAIVTALRERGKITDETLTNWEKRQTGTSTDRVRRFRERNGEKSNAEETHTEPSAPLRNSDETIEKRREEKNREEKKERRARGSRLPPDWWPSPDLANWFDEKRPDLDFRDVVENFKDHWKGASGANACKLDWDAAFRTWARREKPNATGRNNRNLGEAARRKLIAETLGLARGEEGGDSDGDLAQRPGMVLQHAPGGEGTGEGGNPGPGSDDPTSDPEGPGRGHGQAAGLRGGVGEAGGRQGGGDGLGGGPRGFTSGFADGGGHQDDPRSQVQHTTGTGGDSGARCGEVGAAQEGTAHSADGVTDLMEIPDFLRRTA